jgi:hypothetical protein
MHFQIRAPADTVKRGLWVGHCRVARVLSLPLACGPREVALFLPTNAVHGGVVLMSCGPLLRTIPLPLPI